MALEEREKKMVMILGIVAGVALVAFILMNVLGGGDDGGTVDDVGGDAAAQVDGDELADDDAAAVPPPEATTAPPTGSQPLNSFVFSDRDIFSPIPAPVADVSPSPGGDTGGDDTATTPSEVNIDGRTVEITEVVVRKTPLVETLVDGASYRSGIGDPFGPGKDFTVKAIDTSTACAEYDYSSGSVKDVFTLCVA